MDELSLNSKKPVFIALLFFALLAAGAFFSGVNLLGVGIIGILLIILFILNPFWGLLSLSVLFPLQELELFRTAPEQRTYLFFAGIIVACCWLINYLAKKKKTAIRIAGKPVRLFIIYFFWGTVSLLWAQDKTATFSRLVVFFNMLLLYLIFQDVVRTKRQLKIFTSVYFVALLLYSVTVIKMYLSSSMARISLTEAQNPNSFSRYLAIGLILLPYVLMEWRKSILVKWGIIASAFFFIVAIIMAGSRGVFLALLATIIFAWLISKNRTRNFTILTIIGATLLVGANFLFQKGFWSGYTRSRINSTFLVNSPQGGESRVNIGIVGLQMVKDNPIFGVGLGNFPVRFKDYISQSSSFLRSWNGVYPGRDPHNVYLSVQAELGIIGTILFLAFFWSIFRNLWVYRNRPEGYLALTLLVFIFFAGITGTNQYAKYFWLVLSLATTIPLICKNEQKN